LGSATGLPENNKSYQMTIKYLYEIVIQYSKWAENVAAFHVPRPSKIFQNEFLVCKYTVRQPCTATTKDNFEVDSFLLQVWRLDLVGPDADLGGGGGVRRHRREPHHPRHRRQETFQLVVRQNEKQPFAMELIDARHYVEC
jgi:hypothetical protein